MSFQRLIAEEVVFTVLVIFAVSVLYANSLQGTFIWDDRAAVVSFLSSIFEANWN
jgi:hypothetical protein